VRPKYNFRLSQPLTCKDDYFIHRVEEVWRALFGNRERSKGLLNYGLVAMVYAELKLGARWIGAHINDNAISTMYWEDCKGYSRHVHPGVCGDQRDFGILEEETRRDYRPGLVK
jgi:hypothetical protein